MQLSLYSDTLDRDVTLSIDYSISWGCPARITSRPETSYPSEDTTIEIESIFDLESCEEIELNGKDIAEIEEKILEKANDDAMAEEDAKADYFREQMKDRRYGL